MKLAPSGYLIGAVLLTLAAAPADPAPPPPPRMHEVVGGDTLYAIAKRYGVTVPALVAANGLPHERVKLKLRQRLVIPAATAAGAPPAAAPRAPAPPTRTAAVPPPRPTAGPRGLMLAVPDFAESGQEFLWPVEGPVTSTFGRRRSGWHRGIDIKAPPGSPVVAAAAGVVVTSGIEPRYGRVVKIEHDDGFMTVYAHNDQNLVAVGDRVPAGERIATVGRTGRATTDHVHFEIRREGAVYNPLYLLPLPRRVAQVEESQDAEEEHE